MINIENVLKDHGYGTGMSKQQERDLYRRIANAEAQLGIYDRTQDVSDVYWDLFDGSNDESIGQMDTTKTKATSALTVGDTNLISKVDVSNALIKWFLKGQEVTVVDDVNMERVTVTDGGITESVTTIDKSIPVTVVANSFQTSASARPQVLSNGWIVTCAYDSTNKKVVFNVSKNDGLSWSQLTYIDFTGVGGAGYFSLTSKNNTVYVICSNSSAIQCWIIDCQTVLNSDIYFTRTIVDSSQTAFSGCSLAINSAGTELHACWSSKNATLPNSFNIRYAKGTINADGSVTWGSVVQINSMNTSGQDNKEPSITIKNDGNPLISYVWTNGTGGVLYSTYYNGSLWTANKVIYNGGTYTQSSPDAIVDKNGVLWVVWYGKDATDSSYDNIRCSKSTDGGVTWVKPSDGTVGHDKITSGNVDNRTTPNITFNDTNDIYVLYKNARSGAFTYCIGLAKFSNSLWSNNLTYVVTANNLTNPSSVANYTNFIEPIFIYLEAGIGVVRFKGKWNATTYTPHLTTTPLTKSYKKNALVYRSLGKVEGGKLGFSDGFESVATYDVSTPTTVVASAYDTSGNGGRKLVRLSNGWLVAGVLQSGTGIMFYKSEDNGQTWIQFTKALSSATSRSFALASKGNIVYCLSQAVGAYNANTFFKFDATTVTNTDQFIGGVGVDNSQNALDTCSLAIDTNGHLHACWASKNSTYPNSFNIRYSKSTDGGVTWATPTQLTPTNTSGRNNTNPCIVINSDNNPIIAYYYGDQSSLNFIYSKVFDGSVWNTSPYTIYSGSSYTQSNPNSIVKKYGSNIGRIWSAWHGLDSTDTTKQNIRVSYSDDGGSIWSAMTKITTGNTVDRKNVSLTEDTNGNVYAVYEDNGTLVYQKCNNGTTTFGGLTTIGTGENVSALDNSSATNFNKPLIVYKTTTNVQFFGLWTDLSYVKLSQEDIRYNITGTTNEIVSWIDYSSNSNFSIDSKISIVSNDYDESYGSPTKTTSIIDVNTNEDQYVYSANSNNRVTQRITMSRTDGSDYYITKLLGAIG